MRIQADVTRAPHQPASIEELDLDELRDDEILIRVATTGICHTDIATRGLIVRRQLWRRTGLYLCGIHAHRNRNAANYIPARGAGRIHAITALRNE
jgi:hypothetical protein